MSVKPRKVREVLSNNILADGFEPIIDLVKSHDSWLVDARDGAEYLDMFSMYASGAIGYNHPEILAQKDKLAEVSLFKPTLSDIYSTQYADFMKTFNEIAIPEYINNAFFVEGGGLAVENALKTAFDWKIRKNMQKGIGVDEDMKIIHFKQAFHGRTGYTLSLTNTSDPRKTMYFPKFDWPRIDNPYLSFPITDEVIEKVKVKEDLAISQIKDAIKLNPNKIAGLIIEPIQGEGGDNHFRCQFFEKLKNLSEDNEFLLIYDEVQTGIGITGKMWAHQHFTPNLCRCDTTIKKAPIPDIISFGKKTQVCGMLAGNRVLEVEKNVFSESSRINSTFGGSLVDMVRFRIILETIKKESLLDNASSKGNYLMEKMRFLESSFPGFVSNSRGSGLFCAFDLPSSTERDRVISQAYKNKLLILSSGDYTVRFRPHLTVTKQELDYAIDMIHKSIKEILN
ncbi:MAG: L-lysine 6-transaminase [Candidatus Marinimicrobia bacterium]|nr:L-lysine 6-transaminase [Candidatus Neomarinimicrobiota bacterium]|tara:strand:- start:6424 stop:7782 length:1359 start_codon:yes stop_codon:yes gene_type:complete